MVASIDTRRHLLSDGPERTAAARCGGRAWRACLAAGILLMSLTAKAAADEGGPFPVIKGKFGSKSLSYEMRGDFIDYGGRVQVAFDEGKLYRRLDSVSYDYYFLGRGRLTIIDTTGLDVCWYHTFGNNRTLDFVSAYICGDRFPALLMLDPAGWREDKISRQQWQRLQFLLKAPDRYFGVTLAGELGIWPGENPFPLPVWVDLELDNGEKLVLDLSPDITEQLNLYHYDQKFDTPYLMAGFDLNETLKLSPIQIDSSVISITLKESGNFDAVSTVYFPPQTDHRGVRLNLPRLFRVDSVFDARSRPLPFIKEKWRSNFYLGPRPETADGTDFVTVHYRGKFLRSYHAGVDFPVNMTTWFPHLRGRNLGRYTIHYTLHKDLTLISVGAKIDERVEGDQKTVSYGTGDISYVSFASGIYDTMTDSVRGVPVTMFLRRETTRGLFNRGFPRTVLSDLSDAFAAFYDWFGPPQAANLRIVDQPLSTGQSSPGLIHLSEISFETRRDQSRFRAHEIAHQWWGHTAVPQTERDMWLSEGLSEMSAAMYLLDVKHDTVAYGDLVEYWRRQIVQKGNINGYYSRGYEAGPIIMGARLLQSYSPGDYIALVYSKSAYMLQMLRFEIDGPDYRSDFFKIMLAEYCRRFHEKQASSLDFMRIVQEYIGPSRAVRFFDQWLLDWKIPSFECWYTVEPDRKGRPIVNLRIEVSEVDDDFETPFPVEIEFDDGSKRLFRVDGIGQYDVHSLGPFPSGVKKVRFDPAHIILRRDLKVHDR